MPIGSWQNLHAYYNCWPDGTANDSNNFAARLIGGVENCHTRMSGAAYPDQNPGAVEEAKVRGLQSLALGPACTTHQL